ncbi:MAG: GGDEF domain-containing protein [Butyrivibrio sp.]|nr:GGDEF domain-containing protein [Butyrivibrio sp.]
MAYNYYFDICAIFILATVILISLSRRQVPSYRQRAYYLLFSATMLSTVSEVFETNMQMNPSSAFWYRPMELFLGSVYFIAHLGTGFFYLIYIMSVLDIYVDFKDEADLFTIFMGYISGIILVFINLFTGVLFYYDENGIYHRGALIFLYYVLAAYYIGYGISLVIKNNRLMRHRTKAIVFTYVAFAVIGIAIQYFNPTLLIENLMSTLSVTLVFITLQNPSEMVDENFNILNRKAFLEGLDLKTNRKKSKSTIFISIDNIKVLADEIGFDQMMIVLKNVTAYLRKVGFSDYSLQNYTYRYSENVFAVTVYSDDKKRIDSLTASIVERFRQPWYIDNMALRVEAHCFVMKYPDNYKTVSELMARVDLILENVSEKRERLIDITRPEYSEKKKVQDYELMARKNLDKKTTRIVYQPFLSKLYRVNYTADVICHMLDDEGNEVDIRFAMPTVRSPQALMDVDEYVYRQACRALSFWNAGDKNGKYRAVVGMSQGEISRSDFIRRIRRILSEERAEASWITLKLSETTLTTMNAVAERNLRMLGKQKCHIMVDRFGSGYGDLDRILSLPITQVNINREILEKACESEKMKLVTQGIVNLFHDISIFVGATGISCKEDLDMAEELGCDFIIGDYMGAPVKDSSFVRKIDAYFEEG